MQNFGIMPASSSDPLPTEDFTFNFEKVEVALSHDNEWRYVPVRRFVFGNLTLKRGL